tara:strand:- start:358 stop:1068 length:711 start_codon:yes stop_codon:yes gene_type:complete
VDYLLLKKWLAPLSVILIFVLQYLFFSVSSKAVFRDERYIQNVCRSIHEKRHPYWDRYLVVRKALSAEDCDALVSESESYANQHGWANDRHVDYPTNDNAVTSDWRNYPIISKFYRRVLLPRMSNNYALIKRYFGINELFLVKYSAQGQRSLKSHRDDSEFSFILALNDGYVGGGTRFTDLGKTVYLEKGDLLVFSGQMRHQGMQVRKGDRYLLVGFLNYGGVDYCDNYLDDDSDD